jgi:hypothetical protein
VQVYGNYLERRRIGLCKETCSNNSVTQDTVLSNLTQSRNRRFAEVVESFERRKHILCRRKCVGHVKVKESLCSKVRDSDRCSYFKCNLRCCKTCCISRILEVSFQNLPVQYYTTSLIRYLCLNISEYFSLKVC